MTSGRRDTAHSARFVKLQVGHSAWYKGWTGCSIREFENMRQLQRAQIMSQGSTCCPTELGTYHGVPRQLHGVQRVGE